ncbi:AGC family protein kinase [Plakobranchus ocellatus]|uniref:non-specific serine/threonine protein kinase n=1 Tax=Plakobranchus ocellatus TaxID=259542 RepID=A0AAV4DHW4_9GAST|nr:AGC family protein kinase [Plakobranchus ocellatus]
MDNSNAPSSRSVKRRRSLMENDECPQREGDDQSLNPSTSSQTRTDSTAPQSAVHGSHQNLRQKRRLVAIGVAETSGTNAENSAIVISRRNSPDRVSAPPLREAAEPAAQRGANAVMSSPQSAIPNNGTATAQSTTTTVTEADQNFVLDQMYLNRVAYLEGRNYRHILLCVDRIHPRNQVVLKFYPLNSARFIREVIALRKLKHPNVVKLIASPSYPRTHLLVFNYCRNGTLASCIGKIDFDTIVNYFIKISHALDYIHFQNIIHGDIKPANILLDDSKNPIICDFDVSQLLPVGTTQIRGRRGTDGFMAPEMEHDRSGVFNGYKTDAFSLGALLMCLLVGFDLTGHPRNDLHLLTDRPKWPHGPVFIMIRRILQNLLNPIWQERWDVHQVIREIFENRAILGEFFGTHEWIHLCFQLIPDSTRYGPPNRGESTR